jgi:hypothetical protein
MATEDGNRIIPGEATQRRNLLNLHVYRLLQEANVRGGTYGRGDCGGKYFPEHDRDRSYYNLIK